MPQGVSLIINLLICLNCSPDLHYTVYCCLVHQKRSMGFALLLQYWFAGKSCWLNSHKTAQKRLKICCVKKKKTPSQLCRKTRKKKQNVICVVGRERIVYSKVHHSCIHKNIFISSFPHVNFNINAIKKNACKILWAYKQHWL